MRMGNVLYERSVLYNINTRKKFAQMSTFLRQIITFIFYIIESLVPAPKNHFRIGQSFENVSTTAAIVYKIYECM